MISASSRCGLNRHRYRFSRSLAALPACSKADAIWYASDIIIILLICFMLQPRFMNSTASQSSNA